METIRIETNNLIAEWNREEKKGKATYKNIGVEEEIKDEREYEFIVKAEILLLIAYIKI